MNEPSFEDFNLAINVVKNECIKKNIDISKIDINEMAVKVIKVADSIGCDYRESYLISIVESMINKGMFE